MKAVYYSKTGFNVNQTTQGETIEQKIERITTNKEPITDGAPLIYTERGKGVDPAHNIRTDRFEIALDAINAIQASNQASREKKADLKIVKDGETESTHDTGTDK